MNDRVNKKFHGSQSEINGGKQEASYYRIIGRQFRVWAVMLLLIGGVKVAGVGC
jgi:hypothetical protein